ncbi:glutathione S-transferase protein [Ancylostoma caninum]|uniref:glutathione transferase n=1 Tax=Ancylostoma caninum TaxID=29170 RepID=A0A368H0Z7_ANCCA|nr:glutathione S-transferase protein [Ancylostoma caninum]
MVHYKLTYFDTTGAAEVIREIFVVAGQEFEDVRLSRDDWPKHKDEMPFGQVPVLEVDGKQLAQSFAIARFLARKFGLAGKCPFEEALVDSIADQYKDFINEVRPCLMVLIGYEEGDLEKLTNELLLPGRDKFFGFMTKFLKESKSGYLVGDSLTYVDLYLAETSAELEKKFSTIYDGFPEVKAHAEKIFSKWFTTSSLTSMPVELLKLPDRSSLLLVRNAKMSVLVTKNGLSTRMLKMPFRQILVLEVDGKQLAQSLAIVRFLARKFGFAGKSPFEEALVDSIADQFKDFFYEVRPCLMVLVGFAEGDLVLRLKWVDFLRAGRRVYPWYLQEKLTKELFLPACEKFFGFMTKILKESKSEKFSRAAIVDCLGYLVGDSLTFADLYLAETSAEFVKTFPTIYDGSPEVKAHAEKVRSNPALKKWIETRPATKF